MAKILVVEDDNQLRQNIAEQLELNNHEVQSAKHGIQALEVIQFFTPHLILCDIMMPEMDGLSFIREVKRNPYYSYIPFIFLTAKVAQQDLLQGLEEGAVDYLSKPFLHKELILKVNNITNQQRELVVRQLQQTIADEEPDFQFAKQFTELLDLHFNNSSLTAEQMAEELSMSLSAMQRAIKKNFQRSFSESLKEYRLNKAVAYLTQTDYSIQWVADRCGFSSLSYFSYCFKEAYQVSPLQYRASNHLNVTSK